MKTVGIVLIASVAGILGVSGGASQPPVAIVQADQDARIKAVLDSQLPVGSVIAYFGNPAELDGTVWQLCDGSALRADGASSLRHRLGAEGKLPDLRDRVVRGLGPTGTLGGTGGSDSFKAELNTAANGGHSHTVPGHAHSLPEFTGCVANAGDSGCGEFQARREREGNWGHAHFKTDEGGGPEGQHRHTLGGNTGACSALATDRVEDHVHAVVVQASMVPSFVSTHYVMRIR